MNTPGPAPVEQKHGLSGAGQSRRTGSTRNIGGLALRVKRWVAESPLHPQCAGGSCGRRYVIRAGGGRTPCEACRRARRAGPGNRRNDRPAP